LIHLVGLGLGIWQRRVVGGIERVGLHPMSQFQEVLAADSDLARESCGGDPLGDAAEDQEDLGRAEMGPLPRGSGEHVEHPSARSAAVVDDRGVEMAAVDVEPLAGATIGARVPLGMEQVKELLAAALLVHQVEDREVHGVGSKGGIVDNQEGQKITTGGGWKGTTTKSLP
jgi:hypothetical protein